MDIVNTILNTDFLGNNLKNILIAISVFLLVLSLRQLIIFRLAKIMQSIILKTNNTIDNKIYIALKTPISYFINLLGFKFSLTFINLSSNIELGIGILLKSLFLFIFFLALYKIVDSFSRSFVYITAKINPNMGKAINNILTSVLKIIIISVGSMTILKEWGVDVSGFIASLGLGGLAFALAAKDTAANIFGGILIFSDKPFLIGDWIKTNEVEGTVEEIGLRSSKIRTFAQALVTVPNANLVNSAIINWTKMGKRRIKMNLELTYDTTQKQMIAILKDIRKLLSNDIDIHKDTIFINFTDFNDSSLGIFCYYFTYTTAWGEYMRIRERLNLEIMGIVESNNAKFAFPSTSVYLKSDSIN
jgi:MscS family membrane protein